MELRDAVRYTGQLEDNKRRDGLTPSANPQQNCQLTETD